MRVLIVIVGLLVLFPLDALAGGGRDVTTPNAPGKIAVVDANGKQVGTVVGAGLTEVIIALSVNGRHALLDVVFSDSLVYPGLGALPPIRGDAGLIFESPDCSGAAFSYQAPNRLFDGATIAPPGLTLYLPETPGAGQTQVLPGSFVDTFNSCNTAEAVSTIGLVPAAAIVDLLALFTPPFRVVFTD